MDTVSGLDDLRRRLERGVHVAILAHSVFLARLQKFRSPLAANPSELCVAAGPRSQSTLSCLRACCACHQVSATIAIPGSIPGSHGVYAAGVMPPSITSTWRTPGSALISSTLADFTLPANTGDFSMAAYNIPGTSHRCRIAACR